MRHRSRAFLNNVVARWDDEEWKRNFRIGRPTFRFLCTQLHPHLQRRHVVRMPLSVEERVAITLWRLGTNIEYRSIAHLFGVGLSTVCVTVHEVCTAIVNVLGNDTSGFQLEKMFRPQLMAFYIHGRVSTMFRRNRWLPYTNNNTNGRPIGLFQQERIPFNCIAGSC